MINNFTEQQTSILLFKQSNREHESQIFTQIPKPTCVRTDKEEQSATSIIAHHPACRISDRDKAEPPPHVSQPTSSN